MLLKTFCFTIFASTVFLFQPVYPRHVPRFNELDEDDQQLYRAAYDTPSYDHDGYEEADDMPLGKLDLLKDGMWMIKAKLKEIKAFNKAMAANLLLTKLKVKELMANSMKKHHHVDVEKKKPGYNYQMPPYPQYDEPQYAPPYDPYYGH